MTTISHTEAESLFERMLQVCSAQINEVRRRACKRHVTPVQVLMSDEDVRDPGDSLAEGLTCSSCGVRVQPGSLIMIANEAAYESMCVSCAGGRNEPPCSQADSHSSARESQEVDDQ